jgi:phosphoglycolate phosphatase
LEVIFDRLSTPFTWIGRAVKDHPEPAAAIPRFPRDELLKTGAMESIEAVIFDMDGTLVNSVYDWPEIRRRLGVTGASIIDDLNALEEPDRTRRWAELEDIEAEATSRATMHEGARDLLALLTDHSLPAALVTNNSAANTRRLLDRFSFDFEVVVTRDSGLWKPSGAPITEAARRLGVAPERCLGVGDSHYDNMAAREAGLGRICVLHDGSGRRDGEIDLEFDDIPAFLRYLQIVLP